MSVAGLGEVTGDGIPDFAVGAPGASPAGPASGAAYGFSGTGLPLYRLEGDGAFDSFGVAVAGAGDFDGDGVPDLLVGAPSDSGSPGYARVFEGRGGAPLHSFLAASAGGAFGLAVAGAGDVDRDGRPDLLVGSPADATAGAGAGRAFLFSPAGPALGAPQPGIAGLINTVLFSGAPPHARVYVVYGVAAGMTAVPGCPGMAVDIRNASVGGFADADATGSGAASGFVPASASGRRILLQAAVPSSCSVSPSLAAQF